VILEYKAALGQVLFVGAGFVGRAALKWFRQMYPSVRVLVGGRNLQAASEVAQEVGAAEAVVIDIDKHHLGLGDDVTVAAVVMLAPEAGLNGLSYAQDLGVPYLNINAAVTEIGPELALFAHRATAAPVVLASHWMAGAATLLALNSAKGFDRVRSISLGAIVDEQDSVGPAAIEDMERVHGMAPPALVFAGGRRVWLSGDAAKGKFESFEQGTASLTGLSIVLTLASVLGLGDRDPARPGLYLPELLLDSKWFLDKLRSAGATISEDSK
jgi:hypothetical protein